MASSHSRKLKNENSLNSPSIPTVQTCLYYCKSNNTTLTSFCPKVCLAICPSICQLSLPDLTLPPPQPNNPHNNNLSSPFISMLIILAFLFLIITFYTLYTKLHTGPTNNNNNNHMMRNNPVSEEHGNTIVFHPIWYIPTVGLNPSVINSIKIHTYDHQSSGHVDGSDCAVCLTEFFKGDELRVLPKCNHAFHISCIDTWLRSHVNCPLCRAPVVVVGSDHDQTVENRGTPLEGVPAGTEDYHEIDFRRLRSMERGNNNNNNKGSGCSRSERWGLERRTSDLVGRSFSCTANIFSTRFNNINNNNNNSTNSNISSNNNNNDDVNDDSDKRPGPNS